MDRSAKLARCFDLGYLVDHIVGSNVLVVSRPDGVVVNMTTDAFDALPVARSLARIDAKTADVEATDA